MSGVLQILLSLICFCKHEIRYTMFLPCSSIANLLFLFLVKFALVLREEIVRGFFKPSIETKVKGHNLTTNSEEEVTYRIFQLQIQQ